MTVPEVWLFLALIVEMSETQLTKISEGILVDLSTISHTYIVVLRVMTPCSLVGCINNLEEYTAFVFSIEVNKGGEVADYTEVEGKGMSHG
jgi:hypothetical protein